jgi:hypothetical protein
MPTPTNLKEFADQEAAARTAALAAAQGTLTAALANDKAKAALSKAAGQKLLDANKALDAVHKQLAEAKTPAEAAALAVLLKDKTVEQRRCATDAALKDLDRARTAVALDAAKAAVDGAKRALDMAVAAQKSAADAADRRGKALQALAKAPLKAIAKSATDALAAAPYTKAKVRLEGALPAALRDRARDRAGQAGTAAASWLEPLKGARKAVDDLAEQTKLDGDKLGRLHREFAQAEAALLGYCDGAKPRLDSALAALKGLAELKTDPLTPEQKASLNDDMAGARSGAAVKEKTRDEKAVLLAEKAAVLRAERIKALAGDPDGDIATMEADKANFPDLANARSEFDTAKSDFDAAALGGADVKVLAEWEAEVPDSLWVEWSTLFTAEDTLAALTKAPTDLVNALSMAESTLLAALLAHAARRRQIEYATAAVAESEMLAEAVSKRIDNLRSPALRGALGLLPLQEP